MKLFAFLLSLVGVAFLMNGYVYFEETGFLMRWFAGMPVLLHPAWSAAKSAGISLLIGLGCIVVAGLIREAARRAERTMTTDGMFMSFLKTILLLAFVVCVAYGATLLYQTVTGNLPFEIPVLLPFEALTTASCAIVAGFLCFALYGLIRRYDDRLGIW